MEALEAARVQSRAMPPAVWLQDLPVCFPTRPCADYPPYEADVINLTSTLTPASPAITGGCFIVLGVVLVLVALGLRQHLNRSRPSLWLVALSAGLTLSGLLVASIVDIRFSAVSAIYGLQGSGGPDFYGSWWLVSLAGQAMTLAGLVALVVTATVAVLRLAAAVATTSTNRT